MACELRKAGATYQQISDQLGFGSRANAHKAVQHAIREIPRDDAKAVLALELERLDAMLLGLWKDAKGGTVSAVDRVIRIMERRAALLGLDAPKKQQTQTEHVFDVTTLSNEQLDALILGRLPPVAAPASDGGAGASTEGGPAPAGDVVKPSDPGSVGLRSADQSELGAAGAPSSDREAVRGD